MKNLRNFISKIRDFYCFVLLCIQRENVHTGKEDGRGALLKSSFLYYIYIKMENIS